MGGADDQEKAQQRAANAAAQRAAQDGQRAGQAATPSTASLPRVSSPASSNPQGSRDDKQPSIWSRMAQAGMSAAGAASYKRGGKVRKTGAARLHKGERIKTGRR